MDNRIVRVLLVGKSEGNFVHISRYLEESGCECKFASSYTDGLKLLANTSFDLVFCSGQPGIRTIVSAVIGSSGSVFCAHAVEDGCWWLPVVRHGEECLGAPALRPSEFRILLEETLPQSNRPRIIVPRPPPASRCRRQATHLLLVKIGDPRLHSPSSTGRRAQTTRRCTNQVEQL